MCISSNEYNRNFKINFKENLVPIHSGDVLTKEQTEAAYEFAKIPIEEWELLGYTHDEAIELSELSVIGTPMNIDLEEFDRIVDKFNDIPEGYPIRTEDLKKILERSNNE